MKRILNNIDDSIALLALIGVILLTGINVTMRYIFNAPIPWSMEIVLGLFIWFIFIGISSSMKRDSHISVDFFILMLPKKLRVICLILRAAAIYFTLLYIFVYLGLEFTLMASGKLTPILGLKYQFINIAVPIGGLLTAIHFTLIFIPSMRNEIASKEE